ncbi:MAG: 2-oxoacid:acceptor oxidoreductase family protein [Rhodocyclales bacterium]|nr:2-oxoacid:acceptor oxidoreductase family protein [Rhodocyclales bacterium]
MSTRQPITLLIAALGGEGGGVLAEWLVELAVRAGHPAQATSIPGVAQRTGATTYYVEIHPQTFAELGGRTPVMSLAPVPGCLDLLVASELLEAVRQIQNGFASPQRTRLICSTHRSLTTFEKLAPGDGRYDSARLLEVARTHSRALAAFDVDATAREAGTVPSAVLFGAIAASGVLPFDPAAFEEIIRDSGRGVEASLRGFALAFERARGGVGVPPAPALCVPVGTPITDLVTLGQARVVEFQDAAYGELFMQRVERLRAVARRFGAAADGELVREGARYLALWMAFDDVIRVADLKSRASRYARVAEEAGARPGELLRIADHLKPGPVELAGLLPPALAKPLLAWESSRRDAGRWRRLALRAWDSASRDGNGAAPLALPLKLRADTILGFLALRLLGALRPLRRIGRRHAEEQELIEHWLAAIEAATRLDVALELALCARMVKGYGATNERAKENFRSIINSLKSSDPAAIRRAREAALAEESGTALDAALSQAGAPPRAAKAVPVRWIKRMGHTP